MFNVIPYILFGLSLGFFSTLCTNNMNLNRRFRLTWSNALIFSGSLATMQILGHEGYSKAVLADFVMSGALSGLFIGTALFSFGTSKLEKGRA